MTQSDAHCLLLLARDMASASPSMPGLQLLDGGSNAAMQVSRTAPEKGLDEL